MHKTKPTKPGQYPRKLRIKLDKVASERDTREKEKPDEGDPFQTMWHDFLPRGSAHSMMARVDDILQRIETTYILQPPIPVDRVSARVPWKHEAVVSS
jgi:hypothetical protein